MSKLFKDKKGKKKKGKDKKAKDSRKKKFSTSEKQEKFKAYTKEDLLKSIPQFRDVSIEERPALMVNKLRLCCVVFDFNEDVSPQENLGKDVKRHQLLELVDHVTSSRNWFTEQVLQETLRMVSTNLFRSLPPSPYGEDWDPEEDDPALDPQWPHLQLCYEYLLRFVVSNQADVKMLRKHIDKHRFLVEMIGLFRSEDPRERDYLKTILHRIYGKFMAFRSFIRKQISNVFYKVIYEEGRHNGISELLEILGSIINGFALPLKAEHKQFLKSVLIPLHKVRTLSQFSQQLAYCVTQYIDKDPSLASFVIRGLLKYWPAQSAVKEQLFLNELEEVLEASSEKELKRVMIPLFKTIAKCVKSPHFQVAERALFLWNNGNIATFSNENRHVILPILYPALNANTQNHWNTTVHSLAFNIIRMFMDFDLDLWDRVSKKYAKEKEAKAKKELSRKEKWEKLRKIAAAKKSLQDSEVAG